MKRFEAIVDMQLTYTQTHSVIILTGDTQPEYRTQTVNIY